MDMGGKNLWGVEGGNNGVKIVGSGNFGGWVHKCRK